MNLCTTQSTQTPNSQFRRISNRKIRDDLLVLLLLAVIPNGYPVFVGQGLFALDDERALPEFSNKSFYYYI